MNTKSLFPASRLAVLALATVTVFTFSACSGDDNEPSVENVLSTETTPVEFSFPGYERYDSYTMFDYAGNNYIGSDSVDFRSSCTLNMRQGKHYIVWFYGVSHERENQDWPQYAQYIGKYNSGVHYDPVEKTLTSYDEYGTTDIFYKEQDIEVFPYLLPTQQVYFDQTATSRILVNITDAVDNININEQTPVHEVEDLWYYQRVGTMDGYPDVKSVSLVNNDNKVESIPFQSAISATIHYRKYFENINYDVDDFSVSGVTVLCPLKGLDNIQLSAEIKDREGKIIPTTQLPKCSIRRNCKTVLTGPLFSGSTSDWTVTIEPYN